MENTTEIIIPKYQIGDKVRIVNFGHLIWSNKPMEGLKLFSHEGNSFNYDLHPEWIGKEVVITGVSDHPNPKYTYSTSLFAWAKESQLELIKSEKQ